jgi:hypothetical protein
VSAEEKNKALVRRWWEEVWDHPPNFSECSCEPFREQGTKA